MSCPRKSVVSFRLMPFFRQGGSVRSRTLAASVPLSLGVLIAVLPLGFTPVARAQANKTPPPSQKGLDFKPSVPDVSGSGALDTRHLYTDSYAIIIGVSHYKNSSINLEYADKDATDLAAVLVKSYDFPRSHITLLTNDKATKGNIEEALSDLADGTKYTEGTRVLVYFSGHGATVKNPSGGDAGFLIPYDADVDLKHPENRSGFQRTCLPMNTIWDYFTASSARHVFLIADACYGGLLAHSRAFASEKTSATVLKQVLARPAKQALTAGGAGQTVEEDPQWGHGALTYKLLEELKAQAATPGNIFLASDLGASLITSVGNITGGRQRPIFANRDTEGDFVFYTTTAAAPAAAPVFSAASPAGGVPAANAATVHPPTSGAVTSAVSASGFDFSRIAGQKVIVNVVKELKSGDGDENDKIDFVVSEDVVLPGQTTPLITKGTPAVGHLIESKKSGFLGKPGKLNFSCDYILLKDGTHVGLGPDQGNEKSGSKNSGTMFAAALFTGFGAALVKGKNISVKPDQPLTVYIGAAGPGTASPATSGNNWQPLDHVPPLETMATG